MTEVEIAGEYHRVTVKADGDLADVARRARKLWNATVQPPPPLRSGTGFLAERADRTDPPTARVP